VGEFWYGQEDIRGQPHAPAGLASVNDPRCPFYRGVWWSSDPVVTVWRKITLLSLSGNNVFCVVAASFFPEFGGVVFCRNITAHVPEHKI